MTQSGIKARNQGRRGSEIKDISLSVQTASGLIEQRKTFVDLSASFVFRPTQLSKVQKVSREVSERMCRS